MELKDLNISQLTYIAIETEDESLALLVIEAICDFPDERGGHVDKENALITISSISKFGNVTKKALEGIINNPNVSGSGLVHIVESQFDIDLVSKATDLMLDNPCLSEDSRVAIAVLCRDENAADRIMKAITKGSVVDISSLYLISVEGLTKTARMLAQEELIRRYSFLEGEMYEIFKDGETDEIKLKAATLLVDNPSTSEYSLALISKKCKTPETRKAAKDKLSTPSWEFAYQLAAGK